MKKDKLEQFLKSLNIEFRDFLDYKIGTEVKYENSEPIFCESDILKFLEYYYDTENKKIEVVLSNPGNNLHEAINLSISILFYNKNVDNISFLFNKIPIKITQFDTKNQILEKYVNDLNLLKK